ncbi:hypothetical protein CBM2595_A70014 [Cupriavidus taiwanensis]|nr:hypothetical protein CBM2595_A70014 [Cupriavidus taiwanensis]
MVRSRRRWFAQTCSRFLQSFVPDPMGTPAGALEARAGGKHCYITDSAGSCGTPDFSRGALASTNGLSLGRKSPFSAQFIAL